ncbi:unnamed protein product, partial [Ectocarpus sp. 12 AP-2014]
MLFGFNLLWKLFKAGLLTTNAVTILHKQRFLRKCERGRHRVTPRLSHMERWNQWGRWSPHRAQQSTTLRSTERKEPTYSLGSRLHHPKIAWWVRKASGRRTNTAVDATTASRSRLYNDGTAVVEVNG